MAANTFGVGFTIRATDLASGVLRRVAGGFARMGGSARASAVVVAGAVVAMGVGIAALSTGLAGLKGAFAAAIQAGEFGQQIEFLGVVTGRTSARLEELRRSASDAALATQFSPTEAVRGLRRLATAGLSGREAMLALTPALQIAQIGEISVASASQAVVGAMKAFVEEGKSAAEVADRLATAMVKTNFQGTDFEAGLAAAAGTQAIFNQTLDDTLIGLGLLRNRGIGASRAATGLREATSRLASNIRARNIVEKLGIQIFDESIGKQRSTLDIMFEMEDAMKDMTTSQQKLTIGQVLGKRGVKLYGATIGAQIEVIRDGVPIILRGRDAVEELRNAMDNSAGAAKRLEQALLNTFEGQRKLLLGILQGLVTQLGEGAGGFLKPLVAVLRESLETIVRVLGELPKVIKIAAAGFFFAGSATLVFAGAMSILAGIFIIAIPFMGIVLTILAAMAAGFLVAAQFGLGLVAVLGFFATQFIGDFGSVSEFVENLGNKTQLLAKTLREMFTTGSISLRTYADLLEPANAGILGLAQNIFLLVQRLKDFGTAALAVFKDIASSALVVELLDKLGNAFSGVRTIVGLLTGDQDDLLHSTETWSRAGEDMAGMLGSLAVASLRFLLWVIGLSRGIGDVLSPIITGFEFVLGVLGRGMGTTEEAGRTFGRMLGVLMAITLGNALLSVPLLGTALTGLSKMILAQMMPSLVKLGWAFFNAAGLMRMFTVATAFTMAPMAVATLTVLAFVFALTSLFLILNEIWAAFTGKSTVFGDFARSIFGPEDTAVGGRTHSGDLRRGSRSIGGPVVADGAATQVTAPESIFLPGGTSLPTDPEQIRILQDTLDVAKQSNPAGTLALLESVIRQNTDAFEALESRMADLSGDGR